MAGFPNTTAISQTGLYSSANMYVNVLSNSAFASAQPSAAFVMKMAITKTHVDFAKVMLRAVGCNWMVCLAVWLSFMATDIFSKCFVIWFCITVFICIGFEHIVVNMFAIPLGMLAGAPVSIGPEFIGRNLVPVTIGNLLGALCLALPFWAAHGKTYMDTKLALEEQNGAPGDSMRPALHQRAGDGSAESAPAQGFFAKMFGASPEAEKAAAGGELKVETMTATAV